MISLVEFKRLVSEWKVKWQRIQEVVQSPSWSSEDWNKFAKALLLMVREYGTTWEADGVVYWDVRWNLQEGGTLICQVELESEKRLALTVAQNGGFAEGCDENYTWFYSEFSDNGDFLGDPYWVEGNWKEALATVLLPQHMGAGYYLEANSELQSGYQLQHSEVAQLTQSAQAEAEPEHRQAA